MLASLPTDRQLRLDSILHPSRPLIVDSFAGGGGASTGIALALGRDVDIAINHDPEAIAMHQANHPQTRHYPESVWAVDPVKVTQGRRVGLAWFSPDCTHHSRARGGKPRKKSIRGLAWVVLHWVNALRPTGQGPDVIILENVGEFAGWCPLITPRHAARLGDPDRASQPSPWRPGWFFRCFVGALRRRGYAVEWRELRASDYGAATIRKRLFLIARCDGQPIVWPEPTHGDSRKRKTWTNHRQHWDVAASHIDWSLPCPSIFLSREEGRALGVKRPLAPATLRRIALGFDRFVVRSEQPFIINTRNGERPGQEPRCRGVDEPLWTTTAQGSQGAIVIPHITKFRAGAVGSPVDEPLPTITAGGKCARPAGAAHALGLVTAVLTEHANASSPRSFPLDEPLRTQCASVKGGHFALVAAFLAKHYGGVVGIPVDDPLGTATTKDHHALVTSYVSKLRGDNVGHPMDEPLHTLSAQGQHFAEVRAFLLKYYGTAIGQPGDEPLHTVTTTDRYALVTIYGEQWIVGDIGMRMLQPRELYGCQGFPKSYHIGDFRSPFRLSQSAQVRMVGNSVPPPFSYALVRANAAHLSVQSTQATA